MRKCLFFSVLRFGKSLDSLQSAVKAFYVDDYLHKLTLSLSKLNQTVYLLVDHWIWLGKSGLVKTDVKRWSRMAARFWFYMIAFQLLRDFYDILNAYQSEAHHAKRQNKDKRHITQSEIISRILVNHKPIVFDTIKNMSDVCLPMSTLGYINTTSGFQGLAGVISSLCGILVTWNPKFKLSPS